MSTVPSFWGPADGVDSKDYLLMMEGDTPISSPISLLGHALTNPSADSSNALTVTRLQLKNGKIQTVVRTKRSAEVRSRSYTLGFPAGALWSPAQQAALRRGCKKTFFMKYLCPEDRRYNHADVFPDASMDEPVEAGDLITIDDATILSSTAALQVAEKVRLWALGATKVYTSADTVSFQRVRFTSVDCPGCEDLPGLGMVTGGGDGTVVPKVEVTDDRFATETKTATGATAADMINALATRGRTIVVGTVDDLGTPTAGSIRVSTDGGATFAGVTGVSLPVNGAVYAGDAILAVGGIPAGQSKLWASFDGGTTFSNIVNSLFPANLGFNDVAFDEVAGKIYIVGQGGKLFKGELNGTSFSFVDLSTILPSSPSHLLAVHVFDADHIAVGGVSNYYAESFDGGATWTQPGVPGTASVVGIAGDNLRAIVATTDGLHFRDVMTDNAYVTQALEDGQTVTGLYTDIVNNLDSDINLFVAVTDAGEVVIIKPFYPNA